MARSFESFSVAGLDGLEDALTQLELKVGLTVVRRAARTAMKPVEQAMRAGANVREGDLREAITMRTAQGRRNERGRIVTVRVGPLKKKGGGQALRNINQKAIAQEFGTSVQQAEPFIRPALDMNKQTVMALFSAAWKKELDSVRGRKR